MGELRGLGLTTPNCVSFKEYLSDRNKAEPDGR